MSGHPYTRAGPDILVAVNPYQWLNLYSEEQQVQYRTTNNLPPHVYEIAFKAYQGLQHQNQSILVSGESGAGKTETVKLCMNFLAEYGDGTITKRLLHANPLLEAFGNAATLRNDNSSRFGKFLSLQFDANCNLIGGRCDISLLEKSRVVGPGPGERNFHILYQIAATAASGSDNSCATFKCLTGTQQMSDVSDYATTLQSLEVLGIHGEDLETMEQALWTVLHLSNLAFENDSKDRVRVKEESIIFRVANLLGVESASLVNALTHQTMHAGRDNRVQVPLTAEQAHEGCRAFAKEVYGQTFQWLVDRVNQTTCASEEVKSIGILDIFGFEAFEVNHFEQLCINYANEVLQHKFAEDVFQSLLSEFRDEDIDLAVDYKSNFDVLELFSKGVLGLLSEECIRPQGSDSAFVRKLSHRYSTSSRFILGDNTHNFGIRHFAEPVIYSAKDFIATNRDRIPSTLQSLCSSSKNDIVARIAPSQLKQSNVVKNTVLFKFNKQLSALLRSLNSSQARYIRCIKPNGQKAPLQMEDQATIRQLRSSGVIAAIKIARSSFPNRMHHRKLLKRYRCFGVNINSSAPTKVQVMCLMVIAMRDYNGPGGESFSESVLVGKTRAYFRFGALEYLEQKRNNNVGFFALVIQSLFRGFVVRRHLASQHFAATRIATQVRSFQARSNTKKMCGSALCIQHWYRSCKAHHQQCFEIHQQRCLLAATKIQKTARRFIQCSLQEQRQREIQEEVSGKHEHVIAELIPAVASEKREEQLPDCNDETGRFSSNTPSMAAEKSTRKKHEIDDDDKIRKLQEEIASLKHKNKELTKENDSIKCQNDGYRSENERLKAELQLLKEQAPQDKSLVLSLQRSSVHDSVQSQEGPKEYSLLFVAADEAEGPFDVSWYSNTTETPIRTPRNSSVGESSSNMKKIRRRSTFLRSTLYSPSTESIPDSAMSILRKKYNDLKQDHKREQDRNRRLAATNESMQAVLFELNEGMGQLSKTNRELREAVDHYRSIFASESKNKLFELLAPVSAISRTDDDDDDDDQNSTYSASFSDSTLPTLSSPTTGMHKRAHYFTFESSTAKSFFGVER